MKFTPDILQAPDEELVCYCSGISKGQIKEAIQKGARSLQDIKEVTGACTISRCKELNPRKR